MKVPEILYKAQRQHRHNFGDEELILAFDFEETIRIVNELETKINQLQNTSSNSDYAKCPVCGESWNMKEHGSCQCGAYIKKRS